MGSEQQLNNSNQQYRQHEKEQEQTFTSADGTAGGGKTTFHFKFENDDHYDEFMRRPRSMAYIETMQLIDMLSSTDEEIIEKLKGIVDEETLEEFKEMTPEEILEELRLTFEEEFAAAKLEFKDVPVPPVPDMVICKCYIDGCDVHAIDGGGNILKHFNKSVEYDDSVKRGRKVYYSHEGCSCVEVFPDCCRVIMSDGSVEKIDNKDIYL